MKISQPDIVLVSPDGEYLMVVEVTLSDNEANAQNAINQVRSIMASVGCSMGLVILGRRLILLRDSFESSGGDSIRIVGEAKLPDFLHVPTESSRQARNEQNFAIQIQKWLETLKTPFGANSLPKDVRELLGEPILSLFQLGELRATKPRWSQIAG